MCCDTLETDERSIVTAYKTDSMADLTVLCRQNIPVTPILLNTAWPRPALTVQPPQSILAAGWRSRLLSGSQLHRWHLTHARENSHSLSSSEILQSHWLKAGHMTCNRKHSHPPSYTCHSDVYKSANQNWHSLWNDFALGYSRIKPFVW